MPAKKKSPAKTAPPPAPEAPVTPEPETKPATLKLAPAKGRPMLHWVGKKPLARVTAFPAQAIEAFAPLGESTGPAQANGGRFYHGDCKEVLAHLLTNGHRGKINLVYIDPPFDSGADYVRKVSLRGKSAIAKLDAEAYSLGEQIQYSDIWANDTNHDGEIFNIHLADIPAKKSDLVTGSYRLPAPPVGTTIAVKIIDMLGEEVVVRKVV
jgi:hypothetical protein